MNQPLPVASGKSPGLSRAQSWIASLLLLLFLIFAISLIVPSLQANAAQEEQERATLAEAIQVSLLHPEVELTTGDVTFTSNECPAVVIVEHDGLLPTYLRATNEGLLVRVTSIPEEWALPTEPSFHRFVCSHEDA